MQHLLRGFLAIGKNSNMAKGRPKKKFGLKNKRVSTRVTEKDMKRLESAAEKVEQDFPEWVRDVLNAEASRILGDK